LLGAAGRRAGLLIERLPVWRGHSWALLCGLPTTGRFLGRHAIPGLAAGFGSHHAAGPPSRGACGVGNRLLAGRRGLPGLPKALGEAH
jgi:hypothetical protein